MTDGPTATMLEEARESLKSFPPALAQDFEAALARVEPVLEPDELEDWAGTGISVAKHSLRSWEAAAEYFRSSGGLLEQIVYDQMREWCGVGVGLMETSPALAGALFRASPAVTPHLNVAQAKDWAEQGRSLYKGTWKSGSLSAQYFDVSPQMLPHLPLSQMPLLVELIDSLAGHSYELASACLGMAPSVLSQLERPDRAPFLEFGGIVASTAWVDARVYFERGPSALAPGRAGAPRALPAPLRAGRAQGRPARPPLLPRSRPGPRRSRLRSPRRADRTRRAARRPLRRRGDGVPQVQPPRDPSACRSTTSPAGRSSASTSSSRAPTAAKPSSGSNPRVVKRSWKSSPPASTSSASPN